MYNEYDMASDERLLQLVKTADANRRWYHRINWWGLLGLLVILSPWLIIYGVARALDMGF